MVATARNRTMRTVMACCLPILFVFVSGRAAQGNPEPDLTRRLDSLFEVLPHAIFEWAKAEGVSDRAAMRIPVDLDGTRGWFQFDTGLDVTLIYGDTPFIRKWETQDGMYHVRDFRIGGMRLGPTWIRSDADADAKGEVIGSLGLDLLAGRLVLIDYPGRRLALMNLGDAPAWLLQRTTWTPGELRDGKFFLTVILDGKTVPAVFFDTGASAFHLTVDSAKWVELTGCNGPAQASTRWEVNSWGSKVTALGAPAKGALVIGSARVPEPQVYYLAEQPRLFEQWPFPATGLIGNAPFWDGAVMIDLGIRPRFGMVQ